MTSKRQFYGRTADLAVLTRELEAVQRTGRARLVAVQGRRQVGKSTLVEHFAEHSDVPYASITGLKNTAELVQVQRALTDVRASKMPLPNGLIYEQAAPVSTWFQLMALLPFSVGDVPTVVIMDEFPWMNESAPGLDGVLKAQLDGEFARRPTLLVLVGSDEAMLEKLFAHDQPLFGKANRRMVIAPFNPAETAEAAGGNRTALELFDLQLVTGGFPGLLDAASGFDTTRDFVVESLKARSSVLVDAAQIRLAGELEDGSTAERVLRSIGADEVGVLNYSRVVDLLGGGTSAQTAVTRATDLLAEKRVIAIDTPVGEERARLKRYRIADSYLRFWFRFVEPHLRSIEVGRSDVPINAYQTGWTTWRGKAIEPIVRDGFNRSAPKLESAYRGIESVHAWWDRVGKDEFDLVGLDHGRRVLAVGSIKWRERGRFDRRELVELAKARAVVRGATAAKLVVVCPAGAEPGVEADLILNAPDLLKAWS